MNTLTRYFDCLTTNLIATKQVTTLLVGLCPYTKSATCVVGHDVIRKWK